MHELEWESGRTGEGTLAVLIPCFTAIPGGVGPREYTFLIACIRIRMMLWKPKLPCYQQWVRTQNVCSAGQKVTLSSVRTGPR